MENEECNTRFFYLKCAFTALSLLASLFLFACAVQCMEVVCRRLSNLPPGPIGWPIVGSLYSLPGPKSMPPCRKFKLLSNHYGPVMFLRMGSRPTLVISNHKLAREFFSKEHDKNFDSRPRFATGKHFGYDYSSTVFSSGKQFDMMKKIYKSELLSVGNVNKLAGVRMDEIKALLREILRCSKNSPRGVVNVTELVLKANLNLMGRMIFSRRLFPGHGCDDEKDVNCDDAKSANCGAEEVEDFRVFVKAATRLVGLFNIGDYIPALRWLDLQGVEGELQRLKPHQEGLLLPIIHEYRRRLEREGEGVQAQHQQQPGPPEQLTDLIATLVNKHSSLSDENIMAVAIDLIVGGSDSMATAVEWTLTELLRHPRHLHSAQHELATKLDNRSRRLIDAPDLEHLPFLDALVAETLRLHPPTPLAIPHYSKEPCTLGGYHVPKETTAYVNIHAIGRDPEAWGASAEEFDPSRFRGSEVRVTGQWFELLPFSAGRRGCPGMHFALLMLKLVVGNLLLCFEWGLAADGAEVDVEERVGVVCSRVKPLVASVVARVDECVILGV